MDPFTYLEDFMIVKSEKKSVRFDLLVRKLENKKALTEKRRDKLYDQQP